MKCFTLRLTATLQQKGITNIPADAIKCRENDIHSVVFPLISAGIFGYPLYDAWAQAVYACKNFINKNQDYNLDIVFAIPEEEKLKAGKEVLRKEFPELNL